jgi:SAM-dependent methyltransferase
MKVYLPLLRMGNSRKCYVCGKTFGHFTKFKGGSAYLPEWIVKLDMIGSDVDNFACPYCNSFDRERHLFMYFDKLNLWEKMKDGRVLHFAPEPQLSRKIAQQQPEEYIKGDLFPANDIIKKIDATVIPYPDNTFDLLIANHILEHIPDYRMAMKEFHRVLKKGGTAILQAPFSKRLNKNFEDSGIDTEDLRLYFYAQRDHVRVFSEREFLLALRNAGFILEIVKHDDFFNDQESYYYGVNKREDLIKVFKADN